MARELILLRHARAAFEEGVEDFDRPLTASGLEEATKVGQWLQQTELIPDYILCSNATRTRQTLQTILKSAAFGELVVHFEPALYLAGLPTLLQQLQQLDVDYQRVMLVGHNPGLEEFASYITREKLPRTFTGELLATANLLHFRVPDDWYSLAGSGELIRYYRPQSI